MITGKELYEFFIDRTTERSRALAWDDLPRMVQDAWTDVLKYVISRLIEGVKEHGETKSR